MPPQDAHGGIHPGPDQYAAISLWQPWASLIALLEKRIETRSWSTPYRGWIAIHATKKTPPEARRLFGEFPFRDSLRNHPGRTLLSSPPIAMPDLPEGAVVAMACLINCVKVQSSHHAVTLCHRYGAVFDPDYGDYTPGRYAWVLTQISAVWPAIPASGGRGIWLWTPPEPERDRVRALAGHRAPVGHTPLTGLR
jgi:hypothetical protein